jgi:L-seryl-tRNA(Ser) seleniumtransferase
MSDLRQIPSVDSLLRLDEFVQLRRDYGDTLVLETLREVLDAYRGASSPMPAFDAKEAARAVKTFLEHKTQLTLEPVINATGVILHTNLGRAVLAESAQKHVAQVGRSYSTLEFDLSDGGRGSRSLHAHEMLIRLSGAEDALVVNNNAAAVLLVLTVLAKRKGVVISRGQLVEIGGGFRVPEVMQVSGARLVEVGTTNRVRLEDYEEALKNGAALVMRAHASNFKIIGFTEEAEFARLVELTHAYGAIFVDDIGSGTLLDTAQFGLKSEPQVQQSIAAGADLVCFSGDKLLGGPQAGIILGRRELIARIKKHPLARAVRADKLCLAALEATLVHYLKGEALQLIPVWQMISAPAAQMRERALRWKRVLGCGEVREEHSTVGGGSLPGETLETYVLALKVRHPAAALAKLRKNILPVIARIKEDALLFDPRTVQESEEEPLLQAIKRIL